MNIKTMTTGLHVKTIFMLLAALTLSATSMPLAQAEIISKNPDPVAALDSVAASPDSVPPEIIIDIKAAVDSISSGYDSEWLALSMQGKLSFTGLPIRTNVKIYMKRGESIIMSARAPIFGEVARVEISPDSVTCINKHSRSYCSYPLGGMAPGLIADAQDILLGQVAVPGYGRMTDGIAARCEWLGLKDREGIMMYPDSTLQMKGVDCAFIMDSQDWQLNSFVMLLTQAKSLIETAYSYGSEGWTLGLKFTMGDKPPMQGELQLSYPDYAPMPLTFTDAGAKYRKTDFKGLMKF